MSGILSHLGAQARLRPGRGKPAGQPSDASWVRHPKVPISEATRRRLSLLAEQASDCGRSAIIGGHGSDMVIGLTSIPGFPAAQRLPPRIPDRRFRASRGPPGRTGPVDTPGQTPGERSSILRRQTRCLPVWIRPV
jgi:hypothetical protein